MDCSYYSIIFFLRSLKVKNFKVLVNYFPKKTLHQPFDPFTNSSNAMVFFQKIFPFRNKLQQTNYKQQKCIINHAPLLFTNFSTFTRIYQNIPIGRISCCHSMNKTLCLLVKPRAKLMQGNEETVETLSCVKMLKT
jgi:hypothetical protein